MQNGVSVKAVDGREAREGDLEAVRLDFAGIKSAGKIARVFLLCLVSVIRKEIHVYGFSTRAFPPHPFPHFLVTSKIRSFLVRTFKYRCHPCKLLGHATRRTWPPRSRSFPCPIQSAG